MTTLRRIWLRQRIFIWSVIILTLDWVTKQLALETLPYGVPHKINAVLNWTLVYNEGAAFSFLATQGGWQRWGLSIVAAVVIALFYQWANRLDSQQKYQRFAIAIIIGGAVGNLIDRLRFGYVIDFIDVHWAQHHWPAFNIADSAICLGIMILLASLWTCKTAKSS